VDVYSPGDPISNSKESELINDQGKRWQNPRDEN